MHVSRTRPSRILSTRILSTPRASLSAALLVLFIGQASPAQQPWTGLNKIFPAAGQVVLNDWMNNILTPAVRNEIYAEYRYQALQMLNKYDAPTTLRVVVGWDEEKQVYLYDTRSYTDPEYQGCFRTRTNLYCCGHPYGLLHIVKLHRLLQRIYPNDPVTNRFGVWAAKAVEHAFRFGLAHRTATNTWEVIGEAQPLGGHPAVGAQDIQNNPLKLHASLGWFLGKPVENWDGDPYRHDMMTIPGAYEALRDPTLNINRALVRKGVALLLENLIDDRIGGRFRADYQLERETAFGKLRLFQVLMNLACGVKALRGDAQYESTALRAKLTMQYLFDRMMQMGPRRFQGLSGRKYENWVSGWNPPEWERDVQSTSFPRWASWAFLDSVWVWGVSLVGPAMLNMWDAVDENDWARRTQMAHLLKKTADLYRYRSDMPYMRSDGTSLVLDGDNKPLQNAGSAGGTFGNWITQPVGTQIVRGYYQPKPALRSYPAMPTSLAGGGLWPEEYRMTQEWNDERTRKMTCAALFREAYSIDPNMKAIHLRSLEELWAETPTSSPYAPTVRYPKGHSQEFQLYYHDPSTKAELPANDPRAKPIVRQSNTATKSYIDQKWITTYDGFNCLSRSNDFGIPSLMFWTALVTQDAAYMDLAVYSMLSRMHSASGPLFVGQVKDVVDLKHDPVNRLRNAVHVGDFTGNPFDWGRNIWTVQVLAVLDGWW